MTPEDFLAAIMVAVVGGIVVTGLTRVIQIRYRQRLTRREMFR